MVDQGIKSWLDSSQDHWLVCSQGLWYKWPKDPNYKEEERCWPSPKCKQFEIADFSELFSTISGHLNCVLFFFSCSTFPDLALLLKQPITLQAQISWFLRPSTINYIVKFLFTWMSHEWSCMILHDHAWSSMTELVFCLPLWTSLIAQMVKNPLQMQNTWGPSLGWEDPLKKGMATLSSILA